jgi:1-acyl-sn-glycerol-3-phosphate acyltransferase
MTDKSNLASHSPILDQKEVKFSKVFYYPLVVIMNLVVLPLMIAMTIIAIILAPLAFLLMRLITSYKSDRIVRILIWLYSRLWLTIVFPFVRTRKENLSADYVSEKTIFVINHESFFDSYFIGLLSLANICFAVRSWPFRIYFYRPFMKWSRYLNVESASWDKTLGEGKARLSEGCSLLFFPEGHRSRNGSLGKFYSGAFKIAVESGAPIVPICLNGTAKLLPPGRPWLEPSRITMEALPPVYPDDFKDFEFPHLKLRKHVQGLMETHLSQMKNPN